MPSPEVTVVGNVCHEWDYHSHSCSEEIEVSQVAGTTGLYFISKLAVDADGAPKAYSRTDVTPNDNDSQAYDWLANVNVNDLHGIQGESGAQGPAAGFYISGTALFNSAFEESDTRHWVDASVIPYIVLPGSRFPLGPGMSLATGCLAFAADTKSGRTSGAIYGDIGRAVGESSIALALRLGLKPYSTHVPPKVTGFGGKRFFYLVFPGTHLPPPWDLGKLQQEADRLFATWGGEALLRTLIPDMPALQPPVMGPAIAAEIVPPFALPDYQPPRGRGRDLSKRELLKL